METQKNKKKKKTRLFKAVAFKVGAERYQEKNSKRQTPNYGLDLKRWPSRLKTG